MIRSALERRDRLGEPRQHPVPRRLVEVVDAALVEERHDGPALAGALHLGADGVGEQHPAPDLVADGAPRAAGTPRCCVVGEVAAAVGDPPQHRRGDAVRLGEPDLPLEEVRVLRGLPVRGLPLGLRVAAGLAGGGRRARP